MPSANGFSLFVSIVEGSVAVASAATVLLVAVVYLIHGRNARVKRRHDALVGRWREIFVTAYTGRAEPALPPVSDRDAFTVLQLFVQFHEIREHDRHRAEEVFPRLDSIAERSGIIEHALHMLNGRDAAEKILALNALGHARELRALDAATALANDNLSELSRAAAQCALRIQPEYLDTVVDLIRSRGDWARSRVEAMLREAGSDAVSRSMSRALADIAAPGTVRLLDYVRMCTPEAAREICRGVLENSTDDETTAAALRSLAPLAAQSDRETALRFCGYPAPIVVISALRVLRKCVLAEDADLLTALTASRDYWVRLRAAEAFVELHGDTAAAQQAGERHPDRYARDAIRQAVSERRMIGLRRPRSDRRGAAAPAEVRAAS